MGWYLICRKLVSAIGACLFVVLVYFIIERSGFVIMIGLYLLPVLLLYGIPISIFSDFATKHLRGIFRGGAALIIHLFLAVLFIVIQVLIYSSEWVPINFMLLTALLSSFLFWGIDEMIKSEKARQIRMKIDELKIY